MDLGTLRQLIVRFAQRQQNVLRIHVIGALARGERGPEDPLEILIELDDALSPAEGVVIRSRWQGRLASVLPMPVRLHLVGQTERARVHETLRVANICVYERTGERMQRTLD